MVVLVVVFIAVQALRPAPDPVSVPAVARVIALPGSPPALPWPATGQAMIEVQGAGTLGPTGGAAPVPIASLAKMMTAYVVLRDHPLGAGTEGPSIAVTPADVAAYQAGLQRGESVMRVTTGETLTQYQLLEALLLPSADNVATILADWDAGSEAAFAAKMNAVAASLGMSATHYADASGVSSATVSNAPDQVHLAERVMGNVVFYSIVRQPQVQMPVVGVVRNYNTLVGTDGIIGVKTGSTSAAGGCFVFAAQRSVGGRQTTLFGVVLGQRGGGLVATALDSGRRLLDAAAATLSPVVLVPAGQPLAKVAAPWASPVPASSRSPVQMVGWPGMMVHTRFVPARLSGSPPSGSAAGTVRFLLGDQVVTAVSRTDEPVPGAPLSWKLHQF